MTDSINKIVEKDHCCPSLKEIQMNKITNIVKLSDHDKDWKDLLIILHPNNEISIYDTCSENLKESYKISVDSTIKDAIYNYLIINNQILLISIICTLDNNQIKKFFLPYDKSKGKFINKYHTNENSYIYIYNNYYWQIKNDIYITKDFLSFKKLQNKKLVCTCKVLKDTIVLKDNGTSHYQFYDLINDKTFDPSEIFGCAYQGFVETFDNVDKSKDNQCCICFNPIKERITLIPCGHTTFCETCIKKCDKCVICTASYTNIQKIFI